MCDAGIINQQRLALLTALIRPSGLLQLWRPGRSKSLIKPWQFSHAIISCRRTWDERLRSSAAFLDLHFLHNESALKYREQHMNPPVICAVSERETYTAQVTTATRTASAAVLQPGVNWSSPDSLPNCTEVKIEPALRQSTKGKCRHSAAPAYPPLTASSLPQGAIPPFNFTFELFPVASANLVVCCGAG